MIKILAVAVYDKEQKADIKVLDHSGKLRTVQFVWMTKDRTPIPDHWLRAVEKEIADQDSQALAKAEGRTLMSRQPIFRPPPRKR